MRRSTLTIALVTLSCGDFAHVAVSANAGAAGSNLGAFGGVGAVTGSKSGGSAGQHSSGGNLAAGGVPAQRGQGGGWAGQPGSGENAGAGGTLSAGRGSLAGAAGLPSQCSSQGEEHLLPGCSNRGTPIEPGCYRRCQPEDGSSCPADLLCQLTTVSPCVCEPDQTCCDACGADAWVCLPRPSEVCSQAERPSVIVSGENSFGMCVGECRRVVEISATPGGCDVVRYTGAEWRGVQPVRINAGVLTPAGHEKVGSLAQALEGVELEDTYGCPDCADGGASRVTLSRRGSASSHNYEYRNPPAALEDADKFLQSLITALSSCESNGLVLVDTNCTH